MEETPGAEERTLVPSGVEPVDRLLGGLERGKPYLAHGPASGKTLFACQFLIEGLRRGENAALVFRCAPEDLVRLFRRLGHDPIADMKAGRLALLKCSEEFVEQVSRLPALAPMLQELASLLGDARPARLACAPVDPLLSGGGDLEARAGELTRWVEEADVTALFVANGENPDVSHSLLPRVRDSFRFELRDSRTRTTRYLVFEKSPGVADQPIEVSPLAGIFPLDEEGNRRLAPPPAEPPRDGASDFALAETLVNPEPPENG